MGEFGCHSYYNPYIEEYLEEEEFLSDDSHYTSIYEVVEEVLE